MSNDNPAYQSEETNANNPHVVMWKTLYESGTVRSKNDVMRALADQVGKSMTENDLRIAVRAIVDWDGDGDIDPATSAITVPELPTTTGEADTELFSSTAHGLAVGDPIVFTSLTGGTGLTEDTVYYVIASGLTDNAFKVSDEVGGSVAAFSTDVSGCTVYNCKAVQDSGDAVPWNLSAITGLTADPATAWAPGMYFTLGDGSLCHWSGTAWVAGAATA